jgi:hypothetical protein
MAFDYPLAPHVRRHGPAGYRNYQDFKPWLRDEFSFRCVYCLVRERHYPMGQAAFSVDHRVPRSIAPNLECQYDNLVYACSRCNAFKGEYIAPDPGATPYGIHLQVQPNGSVAGLTDLGLEISGVLDLNHPELARFRAHVLWELQMAEQLPVVEASKLQEHWRGYPADLPDLGLKRPPGGNLRRDGLGQTHFRRHQRGELASTY